MNRIVVSFDKCDSFMLEYIIICPLVFIAGFVDAIAGGGGLISLPAYLMAGLPAHYAIGTNKFSACMGTFVATYRFLKKGLVNLPHVLPSVFTALTGSWLGAKLALSVPADIFKSLMLVIIPVTAVFVIKAKSIENSKPPFSPFKSVVFSAVIALVIGIYDGFYGPGTGTFLILLLVYVARLTLKEAAGATKIINLSTNVAALTVFLSSGSVVFPLAIIASLFGIAGNYIGANYFISRGKGVARPIIIIVLGIFLVKIVYESLLVG